MQIGSKVLKFLGMGPGKRFVPRSVSQWARARYDSAQTSPENRNHWSMSDGLSPKSANDPNVLRTLRNRSRYECDNNSYASGMADTLANYVVGGGPRLQMQSGVPDWDDLIEELWESWASNSGNSEKLRTLRRSQTVSGEGFGMFITNPRLQHPVKLDIILMEGDQITSPQPFTNTTDPNYVDGIVFDKYGNPAFYHVMDRHPGDMFFLPLDYKTVPADFIIHLFRPRRPGQARGVPEYTPVLGLFAILRRYTLAVLNSAEFAACTTGVIQSETPSDDVDSGNVPGEEEVVKQWDEVPITRGMLLTLPPGYKLDQMDAKQPTNGYKEFKNEVLNEICRCLNMPFNIAAGNSADYNYASGRLDHQAFFRAIKISRDELTNRALDPTFYQWLTELALTQAIPNDLRVAIKGGQIVAKHQWFWDGFEHVDPAKEATAQETRLRSNTTTLMSEFAAQGRDWEREIRQRAKELDLMKELGLPILSINNQNQGQNQTPIDGDMTDEG